MNDPHYLLQIAKQHERALVQDARTHSQIHEGATPGGLREAAGSLLIELGTRLRGTPTKPTYTPAEHKGSC